MPCVSLDISLNSIKKSFFCENEKAPFHLWQIRPKGKSLNPPSQ